MPYHRSLIISTCEDKYKCIHNTYHRNRKRKGFDRYAKLTNVLITKSPLTKTWTHRTDKNVLDENVVDGRIELISFLC